MTRNKREYEESFNEMYGEELYDGGIDGGFEEETTDETNEALDNESNYSCEDSSDDNSDNVAEDDEISDKKSCEDVALTGIKYLPNGLPVYSGIFHSSTGRNPDGALVHNDLVYIIEKLREAGLTFEQLQETDVYWDERNLYEHYGKALRNGIRYMVGSGKLRGLVLQQNKRSNGRVDFEECTDYIIFQFLFRDSFYKAVMNSTHNADSTVSIILSFTRNAVHDCAKKNRIVFPDISEFERDLEQGTVREKYESYDVNLDDFIGSDKCGKRRIDMISDNERIEDFKTAELLSCVDSYLETLPKRKFTKTQIELFRTKAAFFLVYGVELSVEELAYELCVSPQTIYGAQKKLDTLRDDFAKYIAS